MVGKTYIKLVFKTILQNKARFFSMMFIIFVGICFVTGVSGISPKVLDSISDYYQKTNCVDLIIKTNGPFFNDDVYNLINDLDYVDSYTDIYSFDNFGEKLRITSFDDKINIPLLNEGSLPANDNECLVLEKTNSIKEYKIGDKINVGANEFIVSGIILDPLYLAKDNDNLLSGEKLDTVIFLNNTNSFFTYLPITDIYLKIKTDKDFFTKKYKEEVLNCKVDLENKLRNLELLGDEEHDGFIILSLEENKGYAFVKNICEKISIIAFIFPIFFVLVVGLVALTNTSRLIDDDRKAIGCLKSLGYSKPSVLAKYLVFSCTCTILGCVMGVVSGIYVLPYIVYPAFMGVFNLPDITSRVYFNVGIISCFVMIIVVLLVTCYSSMKNVKEIPASLFNHKAPKPGKKILFERIGFIWKRLSFKYKSTIRNMIRYKARLFMTIFSICGSSMLVMAGFGLYDISNERIVVSGIEVDSGDTIKIIAVAVIAFALILSILVLYNLSNMNIGERIREIATLKVLGYNRIEVYGYIYREIFVMSFIGIILGIPAGIGLLGLIFEMLEFGSISLVKWYSYFLAIGISTLFILFVMVLLKNKIKNVDMNDSLKSLE